MHLYSKEKSLVYTNLFFLIPLAVSLRLGYNYLAIIIWALTILSTLHHAFKKSGSEWWWQTKGRSHIQTWLLIAEIIFSLVVSVGSLILLAQKSNFVINLIALCIFIPAFILYMSTDYKKYVRYHAIWHVATATIICLALI